MFVSFETWHIWVQLGLQYKYLFKEQTPSRRAGCHQTKVRGKATKTEGRQARGLCGLPLTEVWWHPAGPYKVNVPIITRLKHLATCLPSFRSFEGLYSMLFAFLDTEARSLLLMGGHDTFSRTRLSCSQRNTKAFPPAGGAALPSLPIGSVAISREAIAWWRAGWANTDLPVFVCSTQPIVKQWLP